MATERLSGISRRKGLPPDDDMDALAMFLTGAPSPAEAYRYMEAYNALTPTQQSEVDAAQRLAAGAGRREGE